MIQEECGVRLSGGSIEILFLEKTNPAEFPRATERPLDMIVYEKDGKTYLDSGNRRLGRLNRRESGP